VLGFKRMYEEDFVWVRVNNKQTHRANDGVQITGKASRKIIHSEVDSKRKGG
jgi:hypothetical protein